MTYAYLDSCAKLIDTCHFTSFETVTSAIILVKPIFPKAALCAQKSGYLAPAVVDPPMPNFPPTPSLLFCKNLKDSSCLSVLTQHLLHSLEHKW